MGLETENSRKEEISMAYFNIPTYNKNNSEWIVDTGIEVEYE